MLEISAVIKHRYTLTAVFCLVNIVTMLGIFAGNIYVFVLPTLFLIVAVFYLCEYVNERKAVFVYLLVMFAVFACIAFLLRGRWESFYIWLKTGVLSEQQGFFIALFLFCVFLFSSAVFYFKFVQYRAFMLFILLFFNPILLWFRGANVHPVSTALLITLFLLMTANKIKMKALLPFTITIFAVTLLTAGVFANYDGIINIGGNEIDFEDASNREIGFGPYSNPSSGGTDDILFIVEADEPLYFMRQTFGRFDGTRWQGIFERPYSAGRFDWEDYAEADNLDTLFEIIHIFAQNDDTAARGFLPYLPNFNESIGEARIIHQDVMTRFVLAPPRTFRADNIPYRVSYVKNAIDEIFFAADGTQNTLYGDSDYTVSYFRDVFRTTPELQALSARFDIDEWIRLVSRKTLEQNIFPSWGYNISFFHFMLRLEVKLLNARYFPEYVGDYNSPEITALAMRLTEGMATDYEKAVALENYFRDFTYDINPPRDREDIEYFLFESQTGACVEYATAMTLMARAAGLNARYVEGYIANEQNAEGQFIIRDSHGHAFTQIFFAPYGWVTFEPTQGQIFNRPQTDSVLPDTPNTRDFLLNNVINVFILLSIACVLGFAAYLFYVHVLAERLFRRKALNAENSQAVILLFKKIHRLAAIKNNANNLSAMQLADLIQSRYGIDISAAVAYYERAMYNDETLCRKSKKEFYNMYLHLYALIK